MKKKAIIIALSIIVAAFASQAQTFTLALQSGYSFGHAPTVGLNLGLNFKGVVLRSGFDIHTSSSIDDGIIFKNGIGYTYNFSDIWGKESIGGQLYATGVIGHAYILRSNDVKRLNHSEVLYAPEIGYKFQWKEQSMGIFAGGSKTGDYYIAVFGIRGLF